MPASTVTEYLAALPADRREALNEVRRGINRALPPGYKEGIPVRHKFSNRYMTNWSYFAKCGHDSKCGHDFNHVAFQSAHAFAHLPRRLLDLRVSAHPDVAVAPAKALIVDLPMPVSTVIEYLAALPVNRREALNEVRRGINRILKPSRDQSVILCKVWS